MTIDTDHRDTAWHRADEITEITPYAFCFVNDRITASVNLRERNTLMRAVFTGHMAEITLNTFLMINTGHRLITEVQITPIGHAGHAPANQLTDAGEALLIEVI